MKKTLVGLLLVFILIFGFTGLVEAATRVRGYLKPSSGRYVMPHYRTSPNSSRLDNWSTRGNYNPFTGKRGHAKPFRW